MRTVNQKTSWKNKASKFIRKVFKVLGDCIHLAFEIIVNSMKSGVVFFSSTINLVFHPITTCLMALGVVVVVLSITVYQWWQLGILICKLFGYGQGIKSFIYVSAGVTGILTGILLNVFELAPDWWELSKDQAKAYSALGIIPDFEPEEEEKKENVIKKRLENWLSHDQHTMKRNKQFCYWLETVLQVIFLVLSGGSVTGLIVFLVSLKGPENSLKLLAHTVSLFSAVSREVDKNKETNEDEAVGF